jgi:putative ABC transport system substrate-binding protein
MDRARRKAVGGLASAWLVPRWSRGLAAAFTAPAAGLAQPAARTQPKRVVVLVLGAQPSDSLDDDRRWFAKEFGKHGLHEGKDIEVTCIPMVFFGGKLEEAMRKAVALRADIILGHTNGYMVRSVQLPIARGIPLVVWGADELGEDSIEALNRRGENVTGALHSFMELAEMRFAMMKQLKPSARRCGLVLGRSPAELADKSRAEMDRKYDSMWVATMREHGMEFISIQLPADSGPEEVVGALRASHVDVAEIQCCGSPALWAALAKNGTLASSGGPRSVEEGALLGGWAVGYVGAAVRLAARVLRGDRAAEIPVERSMKYGFAINLRTARTLGLTVPPSMVLRADRVFE